jgi:hypothetical protein
MTGPAQATYTEDGSTVHQLPDMPEIKSNHCMAVLEGGNIFVAGGEGVEGHSKR